MVNKSDGIFFYKIYWEAMQQQVGTFRFASLFVKTERIPNEP